MKAKRILNVILGMCMMLSMGAAGTQAFAEKASSVRISGVWMNNGQYMKDGVVSDKQPTGSSYTYFQNGVLSLGEAGYQDALNANETAVIYADGDLEINVSTSMTKIAYTSESSAAQAHAAVYVTGDLKISGSQLEAGYDGMQTADDIYPKNAYGVYAGGNLEICEISRLSTYASPIHTGGELTAGIYAGGELFIHDVTSHLGVESTAGWGKTSCGIQAGSIKVENCQYLMAAASGGNFGQTEYGFGMRAGANGEGKISFIGSNYVYAYTGSGSSSTNKDENGTAIAFGEMIVHGGHIQGDVGYYVENKISLGGRSDSKITVNGGALNGTDGFRGATLEQNGGEIVLEGDSSATDAVITVNNGKLTASGKTCALENAPAIQPDSIVKTKTSLSGTATETYNASNLSKYKYIEIQRDASAGNRISVTNGTASIGGEVVIKAAAGATVTVTATDRTSEGYSFTNWSSSDVTFENSQKETTTFTMPDQAVSVTAQYEQSHSHKSCGIAGCYNQYHSTKVYKRFSGSFDFGTSTSEVRCYYLNSDVTVTQTLSVPSNGWLYLCLNGHTLTADFNGDLFDVRGNVVLCDCGSGGKILRAQGKTGRVASIAENTTFEIHGGTLSGHSHADKGGCFYNEGSLALYGGTVSGNTAHLGGAVYTNGYSAEVAVMGAVISDNTARNSYGNGCGGAIYSNESSVYISSGAIQNNSTGNGEGGAIYGYNGATKVQGGTISGNTAGGDITASRGGAIYSNGDWLVISGGTISSNQAVLGGGIYAYNAFIDLQGGGISSNTASGASYTAGGGGLYAAGSTTISAQGSVSVTGNKGYSGKTNNLDLSETAGKTITRKDTLTGSIGVTVNGAPAARNPITFMTGAANMTEAELACITSDQNYTNVRIDGDNVQFFVPVPSYAISIPAAVGGSVKASHDTAEEGDSVTLTVEAEVGYELDTLTVTGTDGKTVPVADGVFVMPACGVTVHAVFAPNNTFEIAAAISPLGSGTVSGVGIHKGGTQLTLTAQPKEGFTFEGWFKDGVKVYAGASYTIQVTQSQVYTAKFAHSHLACGKTACSDPVHAHGAAMVSYQPLDNSMTGSAISFIDGDAYALTEDISGEIDLRGSGTLYLCLNGHTVQGTSKEKYALNLSGGTLVLCDCNASGKGEGVITHAQRVEGGGVNVSGNMTMYGGAVRGNTNYREAGVCVSGNMTMHGGLISDNTSESYTGGIRAQNVTMTGGAVSNNVSETFGDYAAGVQGSDVTISGGSIIGNRTIYGSVGGVLASNKITVSGNPRITDNLAKRTPRNVCLFANKTLAIGGPLITGENGAKIGVWLGGVSDTMQAARFTELMTDLPDAATLKAVFTSDISGRAIGRVQMSQGAYGALVKGVTVTAAVSPEGSGTVSGARSYEYSEQATLVAKANTGYRFAGWYAEGSETPVAVQETYQFIATEDINLTAKFDQVPVYRVTMINGTASHTGASEGETVTVTANDRTAQGYDFVRWVVKGVSGLTQEQLASAELSFTMPGNDVSAEAQYALKQYEITVTADPAGGGRVSGAGTYEHGVRATLKATANASYRFDGWYLGDERVSQDAEYAPQVTGPADYTAKFAFAHSHLACGRTACSDTDHTHGTAAVSYKPLDNSIIGSTISFSDGDAYALTEDISGSISLSGSGTLYLCLDGHTITGKDKAYAVNLSGGTLVLCDCDANGKGVITHAANAEGGGVYVSGAMTMYGGAVSGNYESSNNSGAGVYATGDLTMHGGEIKNNRADDGAGGVYTRNMVMTGGSVTGNTNTCRATSLSDRAAGVHAYGTVNMSGGEISGNSSYMGLYGGLYAGGKVTVSGSARITGNKAETYVESAQGCGEDCNLYLDNYTIAIGGKLNTGENGAKIGVSHKKTDRTYSSITFTDTQNILDQETMDAVFSSDAPDYLIMCRKSGADTYGTLERGYFVSATAYPTGSGTVTGGGLYLKGASVTLTATPAQGYRFASWLKDGLLAGLSTPYTISVTDHVSITAQFEPDTFSIAAMPNPAEGGKVTGSGEYMRNETVTLTATANEGYRFLGWYEENSETPVSADAVYMFSADADKTLNARFELIPTYALTVSNGTASCESAVEGAQVSIAALDRTAQGYDFARWVLTGVSGMKEDQLKVAELSFAMPGNAVRAVAEYTAITYSISYDLKGGSLVEGEQNPESYTVESEAITLSNPRMKGYSFAGWTGTGLEQETETVVIAKGTTGNLSYTANWAKGQYEISIDPAIVNGEVTSDPEGSANEGETIALSVTSEIGYVLQSLTVTGANGEIVPVTDGVFAMPASNVTISAVFVPCIHEGAVYTPNDDDTHHVKCACGYENEAEACSGGMATCQTPAQCIGCGETYGSEDLSAHPSDATVIYTDNKDGTHDGKYSCCGADEATGEKHTVGTDGTCAKCKVKLVAKITKGTDETLFGDFKAALTAWTDGTTLELLYNVTYNTWIPLSSGASRVFDGGEFALTMGSQQISNEGKLIIEGGTINAYEYRPAIRNEGILIVKDGVVNSANDYASDAIYNDTGATLTIEGGNILHLKKRYAVSNLGMATISGGIIDGVYNHEGGNVTIEGTSEIKEASIAAYNEKGAVLKINGGSFAASQDMIINYGTAEITGGTFAVDGNEECIWNHGSMTIGGTAVITGNNFGVYNTEADAVLNITGGTIGTIGEYGHAIKHKGTVNVSGGSISGNLYDFTYLSGTLNITGGVPAEGWRFYVDGGSAADPVLVGTHLKLPAGYGLYVNDAIVTSLECYRAGVIRKIAPHTCDFSGTVTYEFVNDTAHNKITRCTQCGQTASVSEGHSGTAATCTTKAYCDLCKAEYGELLRHSYVYTAEGATISESCSCGTVSASITLSAPANLNFDGSAKAAVITGALGGAELPAIVYNTADGNAPVSAGSYTATIEVGGAVASVEYEIAAVQFAAEVALSQTRVVYSGSEQKPVVTATGLTEGVDFTVSFPEDMTNVGEKTITVMGMGNYAGTVTKTFAITPANIEGAAVSGQTQIYTGEALTTTVTVTLNGRTLTADDYDAAYANNIDVGEATITVTGKGNYTGAATGTFQIAKSGAMITAQTDKPAYTYGETITVTGTIAATGGAPAAYSRGRNAETVTLLYGETELAAANVDNNAFTLTYNTKDRKVAPGESLALTVRYHGGMNMEAVDEGVMPIALKEKEVTVSGAEAKDRAYDGTANVTVTAVTLDGVLDADKDDVKVNTANLTAQISSADAGVYNAVALPELTLAGDRAQFYALRQPEAAVPANVTIGKAGAQSFTDALSVMNNYADVYAIDLTGHQPDGGEWGGSLTYTVSDIRLGSYYTSGAKIQGGVMSLPVNQVSSTQTGEIGTVTLKIASRNYADSTLTITVSAENHLHDWRFTAQGGSITAVCRNAACSAPQQTISLKAPESLVYDGMQKEAIIEGSIDGVTLPQIVYSGDRRNVTEGGFMVSLTLGQGADAASAELHVKITPKDIAGAAVGAFEALTYTGAAQTPSAAVTVDGLTVTGTWSNVTNVGDTTDFVANGNFTGTIENQAAGMKKAAPAAADFLMTQPENLIYTGERKTATVAAAAGVHGMGSITVRYSPENPVNEGTYSVLIDVTEGENYAAVSGLAVGSFTIGKSGTEITAQTDKPAYTYGDRITITGTARATGNAPVQTFRLFAAPAARQVALFDAMGMEQLSEPASLGGNGTFTLTYETTGKQVMPAEAVTLTVRFVGDDNMADAGTSVSFSLGKKMLSVVSAEAKGREYEPDNAAVDVMAVTLNGAISGDTVRVKGMPLRGIMASDAANTYTSLTLPKLELEGADAAFYDVDGMTAACSVTITPKIVAAPTVVLAQNSFVYDGTEKKPAVTAVKDGENVIPVGEYEVSYSNNVNVGTEQTQPAVIITDREGGNYTVSGSSMFAITQTQTAMTAKTDRSAYTYGDKITITGTADVPKQEEQTFNLLRFIKPSARQVALYDPAGKQLTDGVDVTNGTYCITYETKEKAIAPAESLILTVKFIGDANMSDQEVTTNAFALNAKPVVPMLGGTASKAYDGTAAVAPNHDLTLTLQGAFEGDRIDAEGTFAYADALVGTNKTINANGIALTGEDAPFYALTAHAVSSEIGTITKAKLTGLTKPKNQTLEGYCANAAAVMAKLPETIVCAIEGGKTIELSISWSCENYDSTPKKENTFAWAIDDAGKLACYEPADGLALAGSIVVTNAEPVDVNLTGTDRTIAYDGREFDVSTMFTIASDVGTASYEIAAGSTGKGTLSGSMLTITGVGAFNIRLTTAAAGAYGAGEATAVLTVNKGMPDVTVPTNLTAVYTQTLSQVALPTEPLGVWSWENSAASVGNAGEQTHKAFFTPNDLSLWNVLAADVTIRVQTSGTELTGEGLNHADGRYTYGEDIVVTLQAEASGNAVAQMLRSVFIQPEAKQMALYRRTAGQADEQITAPVSETNGSYVLTLRTEDKLLAIGENTLVAKYVGDGNTADVQTAYTVTIGRKPLTLSDVAVRSRYYRPGDMTVEIAGAALHGLEADAGGVDDVQLATGQMGTIISDATGTYTSVVLEAPVLSGADAAWYTAQAGEFAADVSIIELPEGGLKMRVAVNKAYSDADVQATDLRKIPELDTVEEIRTALCLMVSEKGALSDSAVFYDVNLEYREVDGTWKRVDPKNYPEEGIEVTLPVVTGTTPDLYVYTVVHMFTMDMRGYKAGEVEYPVVETYQDASGRWMIRFTVNGLSPVMVAAIPIPTATLIPQTGDHSNAVLYAALLAISAIGLAATVKKRRIG